MLKLKKSLFARNRVRDKDAGDFFNKTYGVITNLMPFIITLFFAPVLITSSLFSKEIILMLANISLCIGYLSNFAYRLFHNEMSITELAISVLLLTLLVTFTYSIYPIALSFSFIHALSFINQMAAAANIFFLAKHVIVPPFMRILHNIGQLFGITIVERYYSKPPLTLEQDRFILDRLLLQSFGHDSFDPQFNERKITSFNNLLNKLSYYINKYDQAILGYLFKKEAIADLETQIKELITQGKTDSSYVFIRKKIEFKTTKKKLLEQAKNEIESAIDSPQKDLQPYLRFFELDADYNPSANRQQFLTEALICIEKEIDRQNEKISSLIECLPASKGYP